MPEVKLIKQIKMKLALDDKQNSKSPQDASSQGTEGS